MHHVAADIAGSASDQDRHNLCPRMFATFLWMIPKSGNRFSEKIMHKQNVS
jgi:hypothetical protein